MNPELRTIQAVIDAKASAYAFNAAVLRLVEAWGLSPIEAVQASGELTALVDKVLDVLDGHRIVMVMMAAAELARIAADQAHEHINKISARRAGCLKEALEDLLDRMRGGRDES